MEDNIDIKHTTREEVLSGGNVNHIVRVGDTVRRPTGYWSPSVHELLKHLEQQGFEGAPRFLGIDDNGREILTFVTGEINQPELETRIWWTDETLTGFACLLRQFHDATQTFKPGSEAKWQLTYANVAEHEVICHNDAAFYNLVFQNGKPAALIDFDMAGPGPRLWDIAYTLYTSVPLGGFTPDFSSGAMEVVPYQHDKHAAERIRKIRLFFEAYGIPVPSNLQEWIIERLMVLCETIKKFAANGNQAFQKMIDEGHLAHYESEVHFIRDHFGEWEII
ncbi:aminoglycoside phosphotransferase family protein [Paenibacillus sambharensis]|uniref:aminoglycoside phosphotransferase family protein n=1 Tax=Paenibacillus sambharensis TaxID=1803190 RepID=UPI001FE781A4|nr:aminoglycoside phosphotransferase family protein [Paenibacillus sambharensis]